MAGRIRPFYLSSYFPFLKLFYSENIYVPYKNSCNKSGNLTLDFTFLETLKTLVLLFFILKGAFIWD